MLVIDCLVFSYLLFTRVPKGFDKIGVVVSRLPASRHRAERFHLQKKNTPEVVEPSSKWNGFVLSNITFSTMEFCKEDVECEEPMRCCKGLFVDYCCDIGGYAQKRRRSQLFPNITFPNVFPLPTPRPVPQPITIPIPIY